jgi:hypothetical protein
MREVAAVLRLRDELSVKIREANAQLKKMVLERELKEGEEITRVFAGHTNSKPIYIGEIVYGERSLHVKV